MKELTSNSSSGWKPGDHNLLHDLPKHLKNESGTAVSDSVLQSLRIESLDQISFRDTLPRLMSFGNNSAWTKMIGGNRAQEFAKATGFKDTRYYYVSIGSGTFSYVPALITGITMSWVFLIMALSMAERLLNLFVLFFIGPSMAATIPLDAEEKRWNAWKQQVFVKLTSVFGNIIALTCFSFIVKTVNNSLNGVLKTVTASAGGTVNKAWQFMQILMLKMVIAIGGAIAVQKGAALLTSVISAGLASSEGASAAQTASLMRSGARLAGAAIAGAGVAAFGKGGFKNLNPFGNKGGGSAQGASQLSSRGQAATAGRRIGGLAGAAMGLGGALGKGAGALGSKIGNAWKNSKAGKTFAAKKEGRQNLKALKASYMTPKQAQKRKKAEDAARQKKLDAIKKDLERQKKAQALQQKLDRYRDPKQNKKHILTKQKLVEQQKQGKLISEQQYKAGKY